MKKTNLFLTTVFLLVVSLSFVSSAGYDWKSYGNSFLPLWNSQYSSAFGLFNNSIANYTINEGYFVPPNNRAYQPLVTDFGSSKNYVVIPNGTFLFIYDSNLTLVQSENVGYPIASQYALADYTQNSISEIIGIWEINSSVVSFRVYAFNETANTISLVDEKNFTTTRRGFAGLRNIGGSVFFLLPYSTNQYNFTIINNSGVFMKPLSVNYSANFYEPLAVTDWDNDGVFEYMTFVHQLLIIFDENGIVKYNNTFTYLADAKFFKPTASNFWELAVLQSTATGGTPSSAWGSLMAINSSGSTSWTQSWSSSVTGTPFVSVGQNGRIAIVDDYDGDGLNDIYVAFWGSHFSGGTFSNNAFKVLKGTTGVSLASKDINGLSQISGAFTFTTADLNNNGKNSFILSAQGYIVLYDIFADELLYHRFVPFGRFKSCIPADIFYNGIQEVICSGLGATSVLYISGYVNENAYVTSVEYNPSITIKPNETLNFTIFATEREGDTPYVYTHKCSDDSNWTTPDFSAIRTCVYTSIGEYTLHFAVRDAYHTDFNNYTQDISVTEEGYVPPPEIPPNHTQAGGGIPIPLKIVDTENINKGLLPEIYYGTLAFLSVTIRPMIIFIFAIFFVLIMLTIALIIKRVARKVGNLAG